MKIVVGIITTLLTFLSVTSASAEAGQYGNKVRFERGRSLSFPDFFIIYEGKDHKALDQHHSFILQTFKVQNTDHTITITSSQFDLGHYPATTFTMDKCTYSLELRKSEKLGNLEDNELVVWKKSCI